MNRVLTKKRKAPPSSKFSYLESLSFESNIWEKLLECLSLLDKLMLKMSCKCLNRTICIPKQIGIVSHISLLAYKLNAYDILFWILQNIPCSVDQLVTRFKNDTTNTKLHPISLFISSAFKKRWIECCINSYKEINLLVFGNRTITEIAIEIIEQLETRFECKDVFIFKILSFHNDFGDIIKPKNYNKIYSNLYMVNLSAIKSYKS